MPDIPTPTPLHSLETSPRSIWVRALLMVVLAIAFQLASTLLGLLAVLQLIVTLVNKSPNERICLFARSLGLYLRHIAEFEGFASEALPFPFADWPAP